MVSKLPKKSPNIWATFVRKFVAKTVKKSPNLVTLVTCEIELFYEMTLP